MRHKHKFLIFLILILNLILIKTCRAANVLPDLINLPDKINIKNSVWHADGENITNLNDFGVWVNKVYRRENPEANLKNGHAAWLEINLITGMGGLNADFNSKKLNLKKAYDADGEYLNLEIKGHKAVFEGRPVELHLPSSLSVNLDDNSVLTVEAFLTKSELIEIAEYFIKSSNLTAICPWP